MKLHALKAILESHPGKFPRFLLPGGNHVPSHYHLTEVGYVAKHFIDCGGTTRRTESCVLQLWVSDGDREHRLDAAKFGFILGLGKRVLPTDDLQVEVEYDSGLISQFPIESFRLGDGTIEFQLGTKHTDCLAREKCGVGEDDRGCGCGSEEEVTDGAPSAAAVPCC